MSTTSAPLVPSAASERLPLEVIALIIRDAALRMSVKHAAPLCLISPFLLNYAQAPLYHHIQVDFARVDEGSDDVLLEGATMEVDSNDLKIRRTLRETPRLAA